MSGAGTTTARPAIVQYWDATEPPAKVEELMRGFRHEETDLRYLAFSRRSAEELIDEHFGERHGDAFRSCAVPAMQADYFRYCAIHALGGVYVDADFGFSRSLQPLLRVEGQLFEQPPRGPALNNLFAFRSPGHPLLALTIEVATRNIENRISENVALVTGPAIFTGLLQLWRERPLKALRELIRPAWRADVDACWEPLVASLSAAVAELGPLEEALAGVRISSRHEMLTWVDRSVADLPYKQESSYWANWEGSIFHSPGRGGLR